MNLPNILTLSRILMIPVFVLLFYLPFNWHFLVSAMVFALAAATDWLDGYLARRWNQATPFGAFLDPVADKLMVAVALALLIEEYHNLWLTLPAMTIIGREVVISALREWMAEMGKRRVWPCPLSASSKPRRRWSRSCCYWPMYRVIPAPSSGSSCSTWQQCLPCGQCLFTCSAAWGDLFPRWALGLTRRPAAGASRSVRDSGDGHSRTP